MSLLPPKYLKGEFSNLSFVTVYDAEGSIFFFDKRKSWFFRRLFQLYDLQEGAYFLLTETFCSGRG